MNKDNSDKKSLQLLMNHLKKLQHNTNQNDSPKHNTRSRRKTTIEAAGKRERTIKSEQKSKITSWLSAEKLSPKKLEGDNVASPRRATKRHLTPEKEQESKVTTKENAKTKKKNEIEGVKPLDITINKTKSGKTKKKEFLKRTASFEKYGVVVPSYEKILENKKKLEEQKNLVKVFDSIDHTAVTKTISTKYLDEPKPFQGDILDCRFLSNRELSEAFDKYKKNLSDILNEKRHSTRHEKFHKLDHRDLLKCSTSVVVFTQEQKGYLMKLLADDFDPEDKLTTYFFQVLLPELCLLIFAGVHVMSVEEAQEYLDKRPLDI